MKPIRYNFWVLVVFGLWVSNLQCTKLDSNVYSQKINENFWKTPAEIAAGKAPAYAALQGTVSGGDIYHVQEITSDEMITPTRGGDWGDGGNWSRIWYHQQMADDGTANGAWSSIYNGIGKCNYIIYTLNHLDPAPSTISADVAEMKTVRAYYFYQGLDIFGNIPFVSDFKQDPSTVVNIPRAQVFDSLEADLKAALPYLSSAHNVSTYGKANKYLAFSILAKMYLNAEIYTGTPRWEECIAMCDSITAAGYSLTSNYYDNFKDVVQEGSTENIFVVPYNAAKIKGNSIVQETLHAFSGQYTFGVCCGFGNNGMSTTRPFYNNYDTLSDYDMRDVNGYINTYRTFHDMRTGQFLIGQQYVNGVTYPPHENILYNSTNTALAGLANSPADAIRLADDQSGLPLAYFDTMYLFSNAAPYFRMAGLRNIKYFPDAQANSDGSLGNDVVLFRYADILLMKAECEFRLGVNLSDALENVNMVRRRAYSGSTAHDWNASDLTLDHLLAERARELAWEMVRRQDLIRFGHYLDARTIPDKPADNPDKHTYLLPIPAPQHVSNPNLTQNPGYTF